MNDCRCLGVTLLKILAWWLLFRVCLFTIRENFGSSMDDCKLCVRYSGKEKPGVEEGGGCRKGKGGAQGMAEQN